MITFADRERLKVNADAGKGVWIAAFVPKPTKPHPINDFLPPDAHVTLGYFRSDDTKALVDCACETTRILRDQYFKYGAYSGKITGCGWFWRKHKPTPVALVNGMRRLHHDVKTWMELQMKEVPALLINSDYDFIPHITLNCGGADVLAQTLNESISNVEIWFPTINVVCGDVRL